MELNHKNLYTRDEFVNFLKFAWKKISNVYTHIMTFLSNIMTFLLWSWYFHCTGWNSFKIGTQTLLIMENVLRTFYIFCDFFGIPKYFLYSTNLKIQKINFYESESGRKNLKKLFLNSPHKRVSKYQFLDFYKLYLCFHRTFMKILKTLEISFFSISWNPLEITCRCVEKLKLGH